MKFISVLSYFLLSCSFGYSQQDQELAQWLKKELEHSQQLVKKELKKAIPSLGTCNYANAADQQQDLIICVSFSMTDQALLSLAEELESLGGVLILRGLPDNSFKELAKRLTSLKNKGLQAAIQINPQLFQDYNITQVPTFILREEKEWYKLSGHVSLDYALEQFEKEKSSKAKELRKKIRQRQAYE